MTALPAPLISLIVDIALLAMLLVIAGAIMFTRSLLASILLMSVYSLVVAVWFVVLDAPDVAFTEAVVGAGVSTIILLGATLLARAETEKRNWRSIVIPAGWSRSAPARSSSMRRPACLNLAMRRRRPTSMSAAAISKPRPRRSAFPTW